MKNSILLYVILASTVLISNCSKDDEATPSLPDYLNPLLTYGQVADIEGNTYRTIEISSSSSAGRFNSMVWMAENLRTTKFSNGDEIQRDDIFSGDNPRWGYYDGDAQNNKPYGKLYNWNAIADARNICPEGWHVPSREEWEALRDLLDPNAEGNDNIAGKKMKTKGDRYWKTPNPQIFPPNAGTNESGFSALPGGGSGGNKGQAAYFWTTTTADQGFFEAWYVLLGTGSDRMVLQQVIKTKGFSCRCVKD